MKRTTSRTAPLSPLDLELVDIFHKKIRDEAIPKTVADIKRRDRRRHLLRYGAAR